MRNGTKGRGARDLGMEASAMMVKEWRNLSSNLSRGRYYTLPVFNYRTRAGTEKELEFLVALA